MGFFRELLFPAHTPAVKTLNVAPKNAGTPEISKMLVSPVKPLPEK